MKRMIITMMTALIFCSAAVAQQVGNAPSLFTDMKATGVGDILTVLIVEQTSASNQAKTETNKKSSFDLDAGPGFGAWPLREIPSFGAAGDSKNESANEGKTSRSGSLTSQLAVKIVGLKSNGDLVIEGTRVLGINNDKEMLVLTGIVRPQDITPQNTVYSYQIADAQITYRGKGAAANGGKPGWIMRVLNWLF